LIHFKLPNCKYTTEGAFDFHSDYLLKSDSPKKKKIIYLNPFLVSYFSK